VDRAYDCMKLFGGSLSERIFIHRLNMLIQRSTERSSLARQTSSSQSETGKSVRSMSPTLSSTTSEVTEKPFHVSGTQRGTTSDGTQPNEHTFSACPPSSQKQSSIRKYGAYFIFESHTLIFEHGPWLYGAGTIFRLGGAKICEKNQFFSIEDINGVKLGRGKAPSASQ